MKKLDFICPNCIKVGAVSSFQSSEDMRPIIFDFAQENGLKILELSSKNQRLETLFTELTA